MERTGSASEGDARSAIGLWKRLDPQAPPEAVWLREVDGRRAALLLGAFDPITNAHVAIVQHVRSALSMPAALCMTKVLLARSERELFTPIQRVEILDALTHRLGIGLVFANRGTYLDVGRALARAGFDPSFIIGSDKLVQLEDPAFYPDGVLGIDATFAELRFIVVPRAGSPLLRDDVVVIEPKDVFADSATASLSSSRVRADVRLGIDVEHLVPPEVAVALGGYTSAR